MPSLRLLLVSLSVAVIAACGVESTRRPRDGAATDGRSADALAADATDDLAPAEDGGVDPDATGDDVTTPPDAPAADTPPPPDVVAPPDAPPADTGPAVCTAGSITCETADRMATCLPDGGTTYTDCPSTEVCVDRLGCRACEPGSVRCGSDGLTLETCNSDGRTWTPGMRCDSSMGLVCEGYRCVNACARAAAQRSYLGCEYWPTTLANSQLYNAFTFAVSIANAQSYAVTATITGGALGAPRTVTIPANAVVTEVLPWVPALAQLSPRPATSAPQNPPANSVLARNGAYRLVTTAPVAVYQFNPLTFTSSGVNSYTNDASLLLPTHVLTGNYMAVARNTMGPWGGEIAVVGTHATPTNVTIRLRAGVRGGTGVTGASAGSTIMYTLNRGDVLQLVSTGNSGGASCTADDLTGSVITADRPVAVFVGHDCTYIPCSTGFCDHLEEQLFPNETWGSRFIVSALRERGANEPSTIRILSQSDGNALTFNGTPRPASCPATLNAGQFCEFESRADFELVGTRPTMVAQYMLGQAYVAGVGDPAMVLEVPTQQFRTSYVFNVPASYTNNFLTVVYPAGQLPTLDGRAITPGAPVAGTPYAVTRFSVPAGSHRMSGAAPFGIKVSGTADYTSYMYPGGLDLNQLSAP